MCMCPAQPHSATQSRSFSALCELPAHHTGDTSSLSTAVRCRALCGRVKVVGHLQVMTYCFNYVFKRPDSATICLVPTSQHHLYHHIQHLHQHHQHHHQHHQQHQLSLFTLFMHNDHRHDVRFLTLSGGSIH
jgi:hypothetical protein